MKNLFHRNRIRGISFHRISSGGPRRVRSAGTELPRDLQLSKKDLEQAKPTPLSREKVNRLLADIRRHELHALVIEAIEHVTHWKQLTLALEKYLSSGRLVLREDELALSDEADSREATEDQLFAIEVQSIYLQWKHRLSILELVAQAQDSLAYAPRSFS